MSAESLRKKSYEKCVGKVILPQIVEDKSLIDSFTGFIQDVVPQVRFNQLLFMIIYVIYILDFCVRRTDALYRRKVKKKFYGQGSNTVT